MLGLGSARGRLGDAASRVRDRCRSDLRRLGHWSGLRSADGLPLPDFMCIGAQKAGTTWLWENLGHHPEVFLPADRYLHYFDRHFARPLAEYASHFAEGRGKTKGEVIPGYGLIPSHRIRYVRTILPRLRLIFILRNPIDRAWSHAVMTLTQFKGVAPERISDDDLIAHFHSQLSLSKGAYTRILDNWLAVFPRDALLVLFNDDIASNPRSVLCSVFRHIGVSPVDDLSAYALDARINPGAGLPMREPHRSHLLGMYREDILELQRRFGGASLNWLRSDG